MPKQVRHDNIYWIASLALAMTGVGGYSLDFFNKVCYNGIIEAIYVK